MANGDELSRRPAGEVGLALPRGLMERLRTCSATPADMIAAADALTRLSSAPVDAGVASAVEKLKRLSYGPEDPRRIVANMLESLSRQNAELRQAIEKVRAEIEAEVGGPDLSRSDGLRKALAILAQHTPKEG